jgi:hypothetical protein
LFQPCSQEGLLLLLLPPCHHCLFHYSFADSSLLLLSLLSAVPFCHVLLQGVLMALLVAQWPCLAGSRATIAQT